MTKQHNDKPMDKEWFRRMADLEATCDSISVGGFAHDLDLLQPPAEEPSVRQLTVGKLIELARRRAGLGVEELAKRADVELADLLDLERGAHVPDDPRTIFQLCQELHLPRAGVMELAGLTQRRLGSLENAAVRFAAHARGIEKLSRDEKRALEEFVKDLAQASD